MSWAEELVGQRVGALAAIAATERTFENTVLALAEATEELVSTRNLVNHMAQVAGGAWHEANEMAAAREEAVHNRLRFDRRLYQALLTVRATGPLSAHQKKYLDEQVLVYERDGIGLSEQEQAQVKETFAQMSAAEVTFVKQLVQAQDDSGLYVEDRAALDGLSEEFLSACRQEAQARGLPGYWVGYSYPNQQYLLANCKYRPSRQSYYRMVVSLAAHENLPAAQHLLELRRRLASLLGYRDYSDYALQVRMAKDGTTAANFVSRLADLYRARAEAEHAELTAFAQQTEGDPSFQLDASEIGLETYYASKLRAEQVGLDAESLRDYFTLEHVKDVMFSTLGELYGLCLRRASADSWGPEVEVYEIWDGDAHLSTVWCDWYSRPGKVMGAWADIFYQAPRSGRRVQAPTLGCVVCNFPRPGSSGQSRLTIRDVETMWHEFGHFVHISCNMSELRQQGTFACRWDFIEAPSQIMENWVWEPSVLERMALHYNTGQPLAADVLGKLSSGRRFRAASAAMRQLSFATEDLALHRDYQGSSAEELLAFYRRVAQGFSPVALYPEDARIASFKHIFGGREYASAYYSYKWAEVIEADLFSQFQGPGLFSRDVGMRYRSQVLARGAEAEPEELVRQFLGRDATPAAMLERDGVTAGR